MRRTRREAAKELLRLIERGPSMTHSGSPDAVRLSEDHERQCRLWLKTWVYPLCHQLIPEFKLGELEEGCAHSTPAD